MASKSCLIKYIHAYIHVKRENRASLVTIVSMKIRVINCEKSFESKQAQCRGQEVVSMPLARYSFRKSPREDGN